MMPVIPHDVARKPGRCAVALSFVTMWPIEDGWADTHADVLTDAIEQAIDRLGEGQPNYVAEGSITVDDLDGAPDDD